ncbi:hypothetical protein OHA25_19430 [Nonomuraea sp. NBC_00507]|uniref:hypothetical protein n=1 Tax=Nonomuraea sp. NBC_00507 TaxID=2976002 RepID=UPI002E174F94
MPYTPRTPHGQQIVAAGGYYLFIVKGNQPTLLSRFKVLPWREAILNDRTDETGHGRREIRPMKICAIRLGLPFPHTAQAIQGPTLPHRPPHRQEHHRHDLRRHQPPTGRITHAQIALIRGHWSIEPSTTSAT